MMMWNRHKNHNRSFLWGMMAGVAGALWFANKMMNKAPEQGNSKLSMLGEMMGQTHNEKSHEHQKKQNQFQNPVTNAMNNLDDLENTQKEALFDAFLHNSKEELASKAKDFQS